MNKLARLGRIRLLGSNSSLLFGGGACRSIGSSQTLLAGGFTKDFKPDQYPTTEAERIAAAKKYNLRPEDYEPFADNGIGYGDYPKMPDVSVDMKSDWEEYDDVYIRRNFGEPVHILAEQMTGDRVSLKPLMMSFSRIVFWFLFGSALFIGTHLALLEYKGNVPIAPKQFPRDRELYGEKHYRI